MSVGRQDDRGSPESGLLLSVLGQFALRLADGPHLVVRPAGQRLLAILAVTAHPVGREWLGQQLWVDSDDQHAGSNLRAVLHRLPRPGGRWVVQVDQNRLRL